MATQQNFGACELRDFAPQSKLWLPMVLPLEPKRSAPDLMAKSSENQFEGVLRTPGQRFCEPLDRGSLNPRKGGSVNSPSGKKTNQNASFSEPPQKRFREPKFGLRAEVT